jgi:cellulose synthase/poly-beta-1,6-N-acetylglucosamine synthase-like glycosyltransferase
MLMALLSVALRNSRRLFRRLAHRLAGQFAHALLQRSRGLLLALGMLAAGAAVIPALVTRISTVLLVDLDSLGPSLLVSAVGWATLGWLPDALRSRGGASNTRGDTDGRRLTRPLLLRAVRGRRDAERDPPPLPPRPRLEPVGPRVEWNTVDPALRVLSIPRIADTAVQPPVSSFIRHAAPSIPGAPVRSPAQPFVRHAAPGIPGAAVRSPVRPFVRHSGRPRHEGLHVPVFKRGWPDIGVHPDASTEVACSRTTEAEDHWATWGAAREGARVVVTRTQARVVSLLLVLGTALMVANPRFELMVCLDMIAALYLLTGLHKVNLLIRGELPATAETDSQPPAGDDLPIYTVLVPLHREGRILPALVERLKRIDYPPERLQILLLIEMDDEETQRAARDYPLPPYFRAMLMPPGQPRTKPRALNIGLHEAQGEYIVIYDAEDQPEPDQLRKAAAALRELPADVACVQARLIFYNRTQSLLTRMFTVDYAVWYDQLLPGLTAGVRRPGRFVPLGGTSNHFRVDALRKIGGWDPFNVTEDCDLGVRLGREGLRVAMLDSTTWEEAVPRVRPWIKQRSRWVKGYVQTYLVHMRRPLCLWKQLGLRGFIDFQMLVGGSSFLLLINPLMWALTAGYLASKGTPLGNFIQTLYPPLVYYPALMSMVVWNFILFYCSAYVCVRHRLLDLTRYTLLTPLYWILMSIGAWSGAVSLIRNPFYWAKTEHGVSLSGIEAAPAVATERVGGTP